MKAKVIAVVNQKDETGKTTVAMQVAGALGISCLNLAYRWQGASCTNAPFIVSAQFLAKPCIISEQEQHQP